MIPRIIVKKVMSKGIISVSPDTTLKRAAEIMKSQKIGSLIVKEGEGLAGIVTEVDFTHKIMTGELDPYKMTVRDIMSSPIISIEADESIVEAQELMKKRAVRHLIVTEKGKPAGVVSARDLVHFEYPEEGEPFWPNHAIKNAMVMLVCLGILMTIATFSPAPMESKADPFSTPEHIKPHWYFLFSYQLLKAAEVFKSIHIELPKLIGVLGQGVIIFFILLLPFLDKNPERVYRKRAVAISIGIFITLLVVILTIWGYIS
ncbi:MAG: CBS domain-containing protein [Nitrospinae bacterium]|nr:CBS domain-containing protein [Nitrospinota bacterium]